MSIKNGLDATKLKMIAIFAMLIDHIGLGFFPELIILRIIGRIAFPIFAFLLVEGYAHTRSPKKYALRLLVFAFISEVAFDLFFFGEYFYIYKQNIFFSLFFSLLLMMIFDSNIDYILKSVLEIAILLIVIVINCDYSVFAPLIILYIHIYRHNKPKTYVSIFLINVIIAISDAFSKFSIDSIKQVFAGLSILPIMFYNGEKGRGMKYFFYAFYPLHLIILYLIKISM